MPCNFSYSYGTDFAVAAIFLYGPLTLHLFVFMHVFFESLLFAKHVPLALQIVALEYCSMRMMSLYSEHWPKKSTELYHLLTSCVLLLGLGCWCVFCFVFRERALVWLMQGTSGANMFFSFSLCTLQGCICFSFSLCTLQGCTLLVV